LAALQRILWDCSHIAEVPSENTGIERVVRELGAAMMQLAPGIGYELVPCVTDGSSRVRRLPAIPANSDAPWDGTGPVLEPGPGDIWVLADHAWDPGRLIGISPWWREGMRIVLFQYDLVPIRYPETTTPLTSALFSRWMSEAVAFADAFVSISEATAAALGQTLPTLAPWRTFGPSELPVVHLASTWHPQQRAATPAPGEPWRLISVGTVEPRKRYEVLLDAMEEHWGRGGRTVLHIVGRPGWNSASLQKRLDRLAATENRFAWLSEATDEELRSEYLAAGAFVSLSSDEGFGLPVVEAAAAGLPLILSDIPVYREVSGGEARFVPTSRRESVEVLAGLLDRLDSGEEHLRPSSAPTVRRSWVEVAQELWGALAALPEPDAELRRRWDHRAALALIGTHRLDERRLEPPRPGLDGPAVEGGSADAGAGWRRAAAERRAALRLRIPAAVVRFIHLRNQAFRLFQQLDARTSVLETRLAALARVEPTANALQQIRAAEAEQTMRFELESILGEVDQLITDTWGADGAGGGEDSDPGEPWRKRVAGLRRRLRSRPHA
jgi:glycosyltransferase involved in cell wall biosynthesis